MSRRRHGREIVAIAGTASLATRRFSASGRSPQCPLAGRKPATRLAAPEVCPGAVWSSLDREMALQFSRIAPAAAQTSGFCHLGNASVQVSDRGLDRRYSNAVA